MISVCMTTYNGEKFLENQVKSILSQLAKDDELLISDDGSTDKTVQMLKEYQKEDGRIQLFSGPGKGVIKNVEFVLKKSRGEIIFFSDQDDIWLSNRVEKIKKIFKDNPEIMLVLSDLEIIDRNQAVVFPSYFEFKKVKKGRWSNIIRSGYIGAGMAITAELKEQALPFPESIPMHDMWLGTLAGKQVFFMNEVLTKYRRHDENVSELTTTSSSYQKIIWRFQLIKALFNRIILKK